MKIYITYDKSFHEIICVHQIPNIVCDICKPIRELKDRNDDNNLVEICKEVQNPVNVYDSPAILGYYDEEKYDKIITDEIRREEDITIADEEDQQPEMQFFNRNTGKMQKLFDVLNKVYSVRYRNHEVGDKGEAVYITLEARDEPEAINLAMANQNFTKYIEMKYFSLKCLSAYIPKGNYVIGKVEYFEGDPRL